MTRSSKSRSKNPTNKIAKFKNSWKRLSSDVVHRNAYYTVRKDDVIKPDGTRGTFHVVERPESVFIVPMNAGGEVLLVGMHKYPTGIYSIENPAGGCHPNERPLAAAKRELQEETGLKARSWKKLGIFQLANGISDEIGHIYLAQNLSDAGSDEKQEEGICEARYVPLPKALAMIHDGVITDSATIVSLSLAALVSRRM